MNKRITSPYQTMDNNGAIHINQSPYGYPGPYAHGNGYPIVGGDYMQTGGNYLATGGDYMPTFGGNCVKRRKPRKDKGQKRAPSDWILLVRKVAEEYDLPYKEAMTKVSQLRGKGYSDF